MTRPDHPLTARVMANRVWLWHFGEGIVGTPDNFGKTGDRPSHPELLDFLASSFVESGWSVKSLHRMIVLSNAYQMSTGISDEAIGADPENKLFSRFPRRRLTVEELRDGLLASDGSLDLTMGGTLQKGFGTDGENSNDRLSLRPETNRRRMIYLPLRRANLPSLLNLFDFGDATTASGKRSLTTVAPQALFMMNSELAVGAAGDLAAILLGRRDLDDDGRIRLLYERAYGRPPSADETALAASFLARFDRALEADGEEGARLGSWQALCQAILASNEFVTIR
jgi:hypothetical protein